MNKTKVEYADYSWNWATGCTKVSPGCKNCYMFRIYERFGRQDPSEVIVHPERLSEPFHIRKPSRIFVNDMGDTFHRAIPDACIDTTFEIMEQTPQHTYLLLTKRVERMQAYSETHRWPDNVWAGTSVESRLYWYRVELLKQVNAKVKFLSIEPLLEDLGHCDYTGIDGVIVGAESGPGRRHFDPDWARGPRDDCIAQHVAFYYKQGSNLWPGRDRLLDGKIWNQMPNEGEA